MVRFDATVRAELADRIIHQLRNFLPDSTVRLRGSLASDKADAFSDIDLLWEVPDAAFPGCLQELPAILGEIAPLLSFRADPDFQNSLKRRLFFISFEGFPLFWRVDLSVLAASLQGDETFDVNNLSARGFEGWSWQESALFNGVAALKSHLRSDEKTAKALLERAYARLNRTFLANLDLKGQILELVGLVKAERPELAKLAGELEKLVGKRV